ncbi:hypothetical protein [Listeria cornellensis]|uniref:Uncharacterized protein n=1 Tax=Listeria cornellensis FSL F6-0969 TaxID=1265820 RepID=W7C1B6_9LIST|nr:hypothetical protein [Listeria cornellensis]EUJ29411.1 hypothetical protein PCORN_09487 [Listeria cornellensis FSL F6-0969]
MDGWKLEDTRRIMEQYGDRNPLPIEKQEEQTSFEIINHVMTNVERLSDDEIRAVVATASYMFLLPADRQRFIGELGSAYSVKKNEILAWEKTISASMEETTMESKQIMFDMPEVFTYAQLAMARYDVKISGEIQALLRTFVDVYPITFKKNVDYKSIVGAAEYAVIANRYPELKDFDQQTLADKYGVSRTSLAVWYRNIKKYCVWEAWH